MNAIAQDQDAFWREVIDKNVLCAERVAQHRSAARKSPWVPLGRLLIREGYLTVRQVMGLVAIQAEEPQVKIGDLAIREGLCTPKQIKRCLDVQSQSEPGPIEVVLRDEDVSSGQLVKALVGYIHHLEGRILTLEEEQQDIREVAVV